MLFCNLDFLLLFWVLGALNLMLDQFGKLQIFNKYFFFAFETNENVLHDSWLLWKMWIFHLWKWWHVEKKLIHQKICNIIAIAAPKPINNMQASQTKALHWLLFAQACKDAAAAEELSFKAYMQINSLPFAFFVFYCRLLFCVEIFFIQCMSFSKFKCRLQNWGGKSF